MNEDAWENLDTWERRDHELIREYLNDAPVRFGERELKAENEQVFWNGGLRIINWEDSWIAPDRWKELSQSKQLREDGNKLESRILKRMEQD